MNRELFRRRLERKGHAVVEAGDGATAVALTASEKPDLVLMDLGLPDIDGWEATRRIKTAPATADVPVVVLSAHATSEARERSFAAGCADFETKPVNWEVLYKKIDEALARAAERAAERARAARPPADEVDLGGAAGTDLSQTRVMRVAGAPAPAPANRILVVEDNDANRGMLCRRLNKNGYPTAEAADGREALDALRKQPFDLVLCDIMMPGVDGYEVLRQMKADPALQSIPIIMISAVDEMASVVRCLEMGADDYLSKPYEPALLFARVRAALDRRAHDPEAADLAALRELTDAAARVAAGTFDPARLAPVAARPDALGALARAFTDMARAVQARIDQAKRAGG